MYIPSHLNRGAFPNLNNLSLYESNDNKNIMSSEDSFCDEDVTREGFKACRSAIEAIYNDGILSTIECFYKIKKVLDAAPYIDIPIDRTNISSKSYSLSELYEDFFLLKSQKEKLTKEEELESSLQRLTENINRAKKIPKDWLALIALFPKKDVKNLSLALNLKQPNDQSFFINEFLSFLEKNKGIEFIDFTEIYFDRIGNYAILSKLENAPIRRMNLSGLMFDKDVDFLIEFLPKIKSEHLGISIGFPVSEFELFIHKDKEESIVEYTAAFSPSQEDLIKIIKNLPPKILSLKIECLPLDEDTRGAMLDNFKEHQKLTTINLIYRGASENSKESLDELKNARGEKINIFLERKKTLINI